MNSLSVCIIAKNEQDNIARCLASIEDVADEIIVVDTGSTDYTVKIAESYGARVYHHPFDNHFAQARNHSLSYATKRWILYIDCDEQLETQDAAALKEMLLDTEFEGFCLSLCNIVEGKKQLTLPSLRVLRNRPEYRFEGRIHEQINPAIERRCGKGKVHVSEIRLYHYGYDKEFANIESKIARNISIFSDFKPEEKNGFYYYNLGNEHLRLEQMEQALECYYQAEKETDDNGYKLYLPMYIIKALHGLGRYAEAIGQGDHYLQQYPNYPALHFLMTACYYELGDMAKSRHHLLAYFDFSQQDCGYPNFNFESSNDMQQLLQEISGKLETP